MAVPPRTHQSHRPAPPVRFVAASLALAFSLAVPAAGGTTTADGVERVVAGIFSSPPATIAADVNADGRPGAADLSAALLGERNPTWPGPFRVGIRTLPFVKTSVTTDEPRPLDTLVWYPTEADGTVGTLGGIVDAPIARSMHPLLVFSHGSCGIPAQSLFLTTQLASWGFVVAAPPHPGNRLIDFDPPCGSVTAIADSFVNRLPDVMFIVDAMLAEGTNPESAFHEVIDPDRIGISGHSFGGQTTLRAAAADPRLTAALALAPAIRAIEEVPAQISIPTMIQGGEIDSITPFLPNQQEPYFDLSPPRFLLEIFDTGHFAFSDACVPSTDCGQPETLSQPAAHAYVVRYAVPFLLEFLAGDARFARFLDHSATPAGALLAAER